jgi:phospholipid/cholesterol/gamma-HCH transport system substrate-binding protein
MAKRKLNHLKLGVFVIAGLTFLIFLLYVIGKNQNLFGKTFIVKAQFENVHGLMRGNNIRFGGMDAGTVSSVDVLNDTTFEVTLLVKAKFKKYIHNNATVNISTDGLMGNKLINIIPARKTAPLIKEGDILFSSKSIDTDEMLEVLSSTNNDVAFIANELKHTVQRINDSKAVWAILEDESLPANLKVSLSRIKTASGNLDALTRNMDEIIADIKAGKGTIGELLTDSSIASNINEAIDRIKRIGIAADTLSVQISAVITSVNNEINSGQGTVNALLKDQRVKTDLTKSLNNIEHGTKAFNDNMEAIKHSFLFRGYFKRVERQKKQDSLNIY